MQLYFVLPCINYDNDPIIEVLTYDITGVAKFDLRFQKVSNCMF